MDSYRLTKFETPAEKEVRQNTLVVCVGVCFGRLEDAHEVGVLVLPVVADGQADPDVQRTALLDEDREDLLAVGQLVEAELDHLVRVLERYLDGRVATEVPGDKGVTHFYFSAFILFFTL